MTVTISLTVTADDVRAFAQKRGVAVAEKGRLSRKAIDAYNKAHKVQYVPTWDQPVPPLTIEGKRLDSAGRVRSTKYAVSRTELRNWARKNGFPNLSAKGRIPEAVTTAYGLRELPKAKRVALLAA